MICCKLNREERAFEKAREKLEKELNMIELLKSLRYHHLALKKLLPADVRFSLKEQTRHVMVDPDSSSDEKI